MLNTAVGNPESPPKLHISPTTRKVKAGGATFLLSITEMVLLVYEVSVSEYELLT